MSWIRSEVSLPRHPKTDHRRIRKPIDYKLKKKIIERDKGICQLCFIPINMERIGEWKKWHRSPTVEYRFDHILRFRDGGLETYENLRLVHHECNYKREYNK